MFGLERNWQRKYLAKKKRVEKNWLKKMNWNWNWSKSQKMESKKSDDKKFEAKKVELIQKLIKKRLSTKVSIYKKWSRKNDPNWLKKCRKVKTMSKLILLKC